MEDFISWLVGSATSIADPEFFARVVVVGLALNLFAAVCSSLSRLR